MTLLNITVTGAAGNIAYALLPRLGELLFDMDTKIHLRLLEIEPMLGALEGVRMELDDCAYPFLEDIVVTADPKEAFKDTDWAILIGARPRGKGMERSDLLKANARIFQDQGKVLNECAKRTVKVLVVGNPCNTNAYVAMQSAPDLPRSAFYAMTMLDQHRATTQLAKKIGVSCDLIDNVVVYGNHSSTMYADYVNASCRGKAIGELIADKQWLRETFLPMIAGRGAEVIKARGLSSAASAANAIIDTLIMLIDADADQGLFSLGVCSEGAYGSKPGTIVSLPCCFNDVGVLEVLEDIKHDAFAQGKLDATFKELADEAEAVGAFLT